MNYVIEKLYNQIDTNSLHSHKTHEVLVITSGEATIYFEDASYSLKKGMVIITPPNCFHKTIKTTPDFEYYFILGNFDGYFNNDKPLAVNNCKNDVYTLTNLLYLNRYNLNEKYFYTLINALTLSILDGINTFYASTKAVNNVVTDILQNFNNPDFNVAKSLIATGYAEDYLRCIFKKVMKNTPNGYLTEVRINHAQKLIVAYKNSISLNDIALLCGYLDYHYLSRQFKKTTGLSPIEYKKQHVL